MPSAPRWGATWKCLKLARPESFSPLTPAAASPAKSSMSTAGITSWDFTGRSQYSVLSFSLSLLGSWFHSAPHVRGILLTHDLPHSHFFRHPSLRHRPRAAVLGHVPNHRTVSSRIHRGLHALGEKDLAS